MCLTSILLKTIVHVRTVMFCFIRSVFVSVTLSHTYCDIMNPFKLCVMQIHVVQLKECCTRARARPASKPHFVPVSRSSVNTRS